MDNKFQIKDKVRVINEGSWYVDMEGEIINMTYRNSSDSFVYTVEIDDVSRPLFYESELVRV
jgi:hypothetical protein